MSSVRNRWFRLDKPNRPLILFNCILVNKILRKRPVTNIISSFIDQGINLDTILKMNINDLKILPLFNKLIINTSKLPNNFNYKLLDQYTNIILSLPSFDNADKILKNIRSITEISINEYHSKISVNWNNLLKLIIGDTYITNITSIKHANNLIELILPNSLNLPLDNLLDNFKHLKILTFGHTYNKPLDRSLDNLVSLEYLIFGYYFNQSLDNALQKLKNLKKIHFGTAFNNDLNNSFENLDQLDEIKFGDNFNGELNDSLNNLTNLKKLYFGWGFNRSLNGSFLAISQPSQFISLINLVRLDFGIEYNQPLNNSLDTLVNLKHLYLSRSFNQPLNNSLDNLKKLIELRFGIWFNQPLDRCLDNLTNLKILIFGDIKCCSLAKSNFNQPLKDSLSNLVNLRVLNLGDSFDRILGYSVNGLENLNTLYFGIKYKKHIGKAFDSFADTIKFNIYFNDKLYHTIEEFKQNNILLFI